MADRDIQGLFYGIRSSFDNDIRSLAAFLHEWTYQENAESRLLTEEEQKAAALYAMTRLLDKNLFCHYEGARGRG